MTMKLFGLKLGKEKAVPFAEFRDMVRLAVRRSVPGAKVENKDDGFLLSVGGKPPTLCNVRSLYASYFKAPGDRDALIRKWIDSLTMDVPEHSWSEAQPILRPTLKNAEYLAHVQKQMQKNTTPDSLPSAPFVGDLSVIVMRDLPGTVVGVTQINLDAWGVTFEQVMKQAIDNLNMMSFPPVSNALLAGGTAKKGAVQEEVGLVFEGDHLSATWLVIERFRDYVTQRLQGDYVVSVPVRNRLVAIRADEPGLIGQMQASNRNFANQMHALTTQLFHVSGVTTGGVVTVHQPSGLGSKGETLDPSSVFAKGGASVSHPVPASAPMGRPKPVDLSAWGGLIESTTVDVPPVFETKKGR
jgi:hypothetical protein